MQQFKQNYFEKCIEYGIEPLHTISKICSEYDGSKTNPIFTTLDLSAVSLSLKMCSAIGAALAENSFFTKLILADTFLGDDGCIKIVNGLKSNNSITYLDLRGNSIRSDGAIAIGQMLRVNTTIEQLYLEWNCIGIWDTGINSIAEALSINSTLQILDLRNNKISSNSFATMAICLKQNTTLKKLDGRWNHAGLVGGRTFVDLLKWNRTIIDIQLAGNEVPEAISVAVERNRDRWQHDIHTKSHAETLALTIQNLSSSHKEAIIEMQTKISKEHGEREYLSGKLSIATTEIENMHEAYRISKARVERLEDQLKKDEQQMIKERADTQTLIADFQRELVNERERRIKVEQEYEKFSISNNELTLRLNSKIKELELQTEIYRKDKQNLLEDLEKLKEKERSVAELWEDKFQRAEQAYHSKLLSIQDAKDREVSVVCKRLEDKLHTIESEKGTIEQEYDNLKARLLQEKRNQLDLISDLKVRHGHEIELFRKDFEDQIKRINSEKNELKEELTLAQKKISQYKRDAESHTDALNQLRNSMQSEHDEASRKMARLTNDINAFKSQTEEFERIRSEISSKNAQIAKLLDETNKDKKEMEKLASIVAHRNSLINRLKEEIQKRDDELNSKDEENNIRMKELQLNINSLLVSRTKRHSLPAMIENDLSQILKEI